MGWEGRRIKIASPASQKARICFSNLTVFSERHTEDCHRDPVTEGHLTIVFENLTRPPKSMWEAEFWLVDETVLWSHFEVNQSPQRRLTRRDTSSGGYVSTNWGSLPQRQHPWAPGFLKSEPEHLSVSVFIFLGRELDSSHHFRRSLKTVFLPTF